MVIGTQLPTQKKLLVMEREDMLQVNSPAGSLSARDCIVGFLEKVGCCPCQGTYSSILLQLTGLVTLVSHLPSLCFQKNYDKSTVESW